MRSLQDVIYGLAERGARAALRDLRHRTTWSYADLAQGIEGFAGRMGAHGLRPDETVVLFAPNRPEWAVAFFGLVQTRGVPVPLDPLMGKDDLRHAILDSEARRLVTVAERLEFLEATLAGEIDRFEVILLDDDKEEEKTDKTAAAPAPAPTDRAVLFYTSGTTGPPKGVPLSHRNLTSNLEALLAPRLFTPEQRILVPLPLYHVYPFMVGLLAPLAAGALVIFPSGLSGPQIVAALRESEATALIGVPRLYEALVAGLQGQLAGRKIVGPILEAALDLSTGLVRETDLHFGGALFAALRARIGPDLRSLACGGAKLDPDIAYVLEGLGFQVLTGYGLTETSPIVSFNLPGAKRLGTAGRPLAGVEVRILQPDESGVGEVLVRGPSVFGGYHKLPEKTAKVLDAEGWFHTDDLGRLDAEGYLVIGGRQSEMIVLSDGQNVAPERLEAVYAQNPAIGEIAIFARKGRLAAVIKPSRGPAQPHERETPAQAASGEARAKIAAALRQVAEDLPSFQQIGDFAVTQGALPRTPIGKLRRQDLPALFAAVAGVTEDAGGGAKAPVSREDEALLSEQPAKQIWQWLKQRYGEERVRLDSSPQFDLGIDSLEWVALTLELDERFGVRLSEARLASLESLRDLLMAAAESGVEDGVDDGPGPSALDGRQKRLLEPPAKFFGATAEALESLDRLLAHWLFDLRVAGRETLPEANVIFAPNHASYLDPLVLAAALGQERLQNTYWGGLPVLIFRLLRRLFGDQALRALHVLPVDPQAAPASALALGLEALRRGHDLVWFPEGARSPDGSLQEFRPGVGALAEGAEVAIVPVVLTGTHQVWPPGQGLPHPGPVRVSFAPAVAWRDLKENGTGASSAERIATALRQRILDLQRQSAPS